MSARSRSPAVRRLRRGTAAWAAMARELMERYGRTPESFGGGRALFLGAFDGGTLVGFGIFEDFKDPRRHAGTAYDLRLVAELLALPRVAIFLLALLHALHGPERLAPLAAALVRGADAELARRFDRRCLLMSYLVRGNARARPLYRRLGFRAQPRRTGLYEIALDRFATPRGGEVPLPDGVQARFFDEVEALPAAELARCYTAVFLRGGGPPGASVAMLLAAPEFARDLSLLVTERATGRVLGFLLAERSGPGAVLVAAAGIARGWRHCGIPLHCFPRFARRALDAGIPVARLVTARRRVARLVQRYLGAVRIDGLGWLLRCR